MFATVYEHRNGDEHHCLAFEYIGKNVKQCEAYFKTCGVRYTEFARLH